MRRLKCTDRHQMHANMRNKVMTVRYVFFSSIDWGGVDE
jgi:hypothetical protein